jgi:hypothetical protein
MNQLTSRSRSCHCRQRSLLGSSTRLPRWNVSNRRQVSSGVGKASGVYRRRWKCYVQLRIM